MESKNIRPKLTGTLNTVYLKWESIKSVSTDGCKEYVAVCIKDPNGQLTPYSTLRDPSILCLTKAVNKAQDHCDKLNSELADKAEGPKHLKLIEIDISLLSSSVISQLYKIYYRVDDSELRRLQIDTTISVCNIAKTKYYILEEDFNEFMSVVRGNIHES